MALLRGLNGFECYLQGVCRFFDIFERFLSSMLPTQKFSVLTSRREQNDSEL